MLARTRIMALLLAGPASAVCLENGTDQRLYGTAESDGEASRMTGWLDPGQSLCSGPADTAGTVGIFDDPRAFEGCSRRVPNAAGPARLLDFARFDRCRWAEEAG